MNKTVLLLIGIFCFQLNYAQVSIEKNKLVKDGQVYKMKDYEKVFQNDEAKSYFKKARTNSSIGSVFAFGGGFCVGFGLAQELRGTKKTITTNGGTQTVNVEKSGGWALVGIGAGLIGIGIPFAIASKKNADKAITIENGETTAFQPYFKLESVGTGLALSYNF